MALNEPSDCEKFLAGAGAAVGPWAWGLAHQGLGGRQTHALPNSLPPAPRIMEKIIAVGFSTQRIWFFYLQIFTLRKISRNAVSED
jgi:hypothetical protein